MTDGKQHVDFPASAPHALGCGGTTLEIQNGQIASETVWNELPNHGAGGGGISIEFAVPSLSDRDQAADNVDTGKAGRGVPDVCGNADPETGYQVLVDGSQQTIGGTSAVAPLWAGLIVLLNASLGKPVGLPPAADLPVLGRDRIPRHHPGQQPGLSSRAWVGCVLGQRLAGRRGAVEGAGW